MRAFDFDGVVTAGRHPEPGDLIITGRCVDEAAVVYIYLHEQLGYLVPVFFNPVLYAVRGDKTEAARRHSAQHKVETLRRLLTNAVPLESFIEDDPLQHRIITAALAASHPAFNLILVDSP